jgi:prolyl 4-hydroxylase
MVFIRSESEQSAITMIVHLNDDCMGGDTVFHHLMLHEGAVVEAGVKYVVRTDVVYRRDGS